MNSIHDPRYREVIKALIQLRESNKMTQVQLATSLKKPQSYVSKIENFERRIDIIELQDWLHKLGIDLKFLSILTNKSL